jgi:predicted AAA+ superfamily ATPase
LQFQTQPFEMHDMERMYEKLLFKLLELFPCVAVVGVRQCGKTTLLKQLSSSWQLFDLEKSSDLEIISRDPDLFLRLNPAQVAIDEAQLLPELFSSLRVAIDADRGKPGRFIITGSSSPELINSISESLAGRLAILELAPFTFAETQQILTPEISYLISNQASIQDFQALTAPPNILQKQYDYWFRGGYPEPWVENNPRFSKLWQQNYVQTYLNRDIQQLFPGLNRQKFKLFLQMLSHLSGTIINYSNVARTLGVSQPTAREYFHIAHGTFIWRHIPPYDRNSAKRIVKHPKGYLRDSGLLHFFLHLQSINDLLTHPAMGHSWEGMVIEEILRGLNSLGTSYDYYHYRTGGGAEVDLILEGEFGLLPIEIKYGQKVSLRELRGIKDFMKENKCRYGLVINNDERVTLYDESLLGIPFAACLAA